jgi:hypothetical protein
MADQFLFAVQSEISGRRAAGDDECPRLQPFIVRFDPDYACCSDRNRSLPRRKTGRQISRLVCACSKQLRSIDSVGKSGIIFYKRRRRELPTRLPAFQHQWAKVRPGQHKSPAVNPAQPLPTMITFSIDKI